MEHAIGSAEESINHKVSFSTVAAGWAFTGPLPWEMMEECRLLDNLLLSMQCLHGLRVLRA